MFKQANEDLLSSISTQLKEGKMDAEAASKLLNTIARFEERVGNNVPHEPSVDGRR